MAGSVISARELGQLFMVGLPGEFVDESTRGLIEELGVNHFILFKRNISKPDQVKALCRDLQETCERFSLPSAIISIDQEGGTVSRLRAPFTEFAGARALAGSDEPDKNVARYARICSEELRAIGVNMNLAPVMDICPAGGRYFMEERVYGAGAEVVSRLGCLAIGIMQANGIAACAKHFPGLGAAVLDPHVQLPVVTKKKEQLTLEDFVPFIEAKACRVSAIMTSHAIYSDLDPDRPATLSRRIITGLLRQELGYKGVIITDDLEMGAIENHGMVDDASLAAFKAGADILLICHDHGKVRKSWRRIAAAVDQEELSPARVEASISRINTMRRKIILGTEVF